MPRPNPPHDPVVFPPSPSAENYTPFPPSSSQRPTPSITPTPIKKDILLSFSSRIPPRSCSPAPTYTTEAPRVAIPDVHTSSSPISSSNYDHPPEMSQINHPGPGMSRTSLSSVAPSITAERVAKDYRMDERGNTASGRMRYCMMGLHFLLLAVSFVLMGIFRFDYLYFALHCVILITFVIYIPAAFIIARKGRKTRFDQAGGEVAYLVVQQALTLTMGIVGIVYLRDYPCNIPRRTLTSDGFSWIYPSSKPCTWNIVVLTLNFVHFLVLVGWMVWVIMVVYKTSPGNPTKPFKIGTGRLMRGQA